LQKQQWFPNPCSWQGRSACSYLTDDWNDIMDFLFYCDPVSRAPLFIVFKPQFIKSATSLIFVEDSIKAPMDKERIHSLPTLGWENSMPWILDSPY